MERFMAKIRRHADLGPFHDLLLRACPPVKRDDSGNFVVDPVDGTKSISLLAAQLGMTDWAVRLWIKKGRIPPQKAVKIVDLNPEEVTLADFSPYVYI